MLTGFRIAWGFNPILKVNVLCGVSLDLTPLVTFQIACCFAEGYGSQRYYVITNMVIGRLLDWKQKCGGSLKHEIYCIKNQKICM